MWNCKSILVVVFLFMPFAKVSTTKFTKTHHTDDNFNRIIKDFVNTTSDKLLIKTHISRAYTYEYTKLNNEYGAFMDAYGYFVSTTPPKNNLMLHKFFLPENLRKLDQNPQLIDLYKNTCLKNQLSEKSSVPPGYNSILSDYRWFLKAGPFSAYSKNYKFELKSIEHQNGKEIYVVGYYLEKPIGAYYTINNGEMYIDIESMQLLKIVVNEGRHFSVLLHKNLIAKSEITFKYNKDNDYCFFFEIKTNYEYHNIKQSLGMIILSDINLTTINDKEVSFLRMNSNCPYIIYNKEKWDIEKLPIPNNLINVLNKLGDSSHLESNFYKNSNNYYYNEMDENKKQQNINERISLDVFKEKLKK